MPEMDGIEATRREREQATNTRIHVIGLTAHVIEGTTNAASTPVWTTISPNPSSPTNSSPPSDRPTTSRVKEGRHPARANGHRSTQGTRTMQNGPRAAHNTNRGFPARRSQLSGPTAQRPQSRRSCGPRAVCPHDQKPAGHTRPRPGVGRRTEKPRQATEVGQSRYRYRPISARAGKGYITTDFLDHCHT